MQVARKYSGTSLDRPSLLRLFLSYDLIFHDGSTLLYKTTLYYDYLPNPTYDRPILVYYDCFKNKISQKMIADWLTSREMRQADWIEAVT